MKTTKTNKTWPKIYRILCNGTRGLEFLTRPLGETLFIDNPLLFMISRLARRHIGTAKKERKLNTDGYNDENHDYIIL